MFHFPFGQQLEPVRQEDTAPKKLFVLGVYASAVHARWKDVDGKLKIKALAVASEPYIFWKGDGCDKIIERISIPKECGTLEPAAATFNGPSGITLDEQYLAPLGLTRQDAWLCDLLPYSRINPSQRKALDKHYTPLVEQHDLPPCTIPNFTKTELRDQKYRHHKILEEIRQSECDTIILLGDLPIQHWLSHFAPQTKLSDFGQDSDSYGQLHEMRIDRKVYNLLPLVHPIQAGSLGKAGKIWTELHQEWVRDRAGEVLEE